MNYQSTRGRSGESLSSAQIIKQGLALDGGLFIPESIPTLTLDEITALCSDSYPERAAKILSKFLTDYTYDELLADCKAAYCESSFPGGAAPVVKAKDGVYSLELWHFRSCPAFFLAHLSRRVRHVLLSFSLRPRATRAKRRSRDIRTSTVFE